MGIESQIGRQLASVGATVINEKSQIEKQISFGSDQSLGDFLSGGGRKKRESQTFIQHNAPPRSSFSSFGSNVSGRFRSGSSLPDPPRWNFGSSGNFLQPSPPTRITNINSQIGTQIGLGTGRKK